MKKHLTSFLIGIFAFTLFAAEHTKEYVLSDVNAELVSSSMWPRYSYLSVLNDDYLQPYEPEGAPMLPYRMVEISLPSGAIASSVEDQVAEWRTLSENVDLMPIQPLVPTDGSVTNPDFVPLDPLYRHFGAYPTSPVESFGTSTRGNKTILTLKVTPFRWDASKGKLEVAKGLTLTITYEGEDKPIARPKFATTPAKDIMLILAPSDLYNDWVWYAGERQKNHPEIEIRVQNTAEIYEKYPYVDIRNPGGEPKATPEGLCRYPSESIYTWLEAYYQENPTLHYVALGGAWLDCTDPNVHYMQDGSEITLQNAIPSVSVNPRKDTTNPTDMYFACFTKKDGETGHHWDPNDNGVYLEGNQGTLDETPLCNARPDIVVSRLTMKPMLMDESVPINPQFTLVGGNRVLDQHQLITNFLYKVNRAEAENFSGNFKMAVTSSALSYAPHYMDSALVLRDETEFFDNAPNMYAPEHLSEFRDCASLMRRHVSEITATHRPVLETVSYHEKETYSNNSNKDNFSQVFADFDREIGTSNGHGWAGGTGWFSGKTFSTCTGLTKINVVGVSCETGFLDLYGTQNGKSVVNLCLGESGQANPTATGGVIASVNNTRLGWCSLECQTYRGYGLSMRLHYWMYYGVVQGMTAGDAWRYMAQSFYRDCGNRMPTSTGGQCYTQEMLFGDPLIKIKPGDHPNAVMTLDLPAETTRLTAENNLLKIMRGISVNGGALSIGINGGVGGVGTFVDNDLPKTAERKDGIKFAAEAGELTFDNTAEEAYYFVNKIENAKKITFAGAGAIINTDLFEAGTTLEFVGQQGFVGKTAKPNVIRANTEQTKGAMTSFLPLTLNNTSLQFETYEAFEGQVEDAVFANLTDSKLAFRVSRWRGLGEEYSETLRGTLNLNSSILAADYPAYIHLSHPTINVRGNSSIETTNGGTFKVDGELRIVLQNNATLTIDADLELQEDSAITIGGSGRVIVKAAKGLVGDVRIEEGVTLELTELPLVDTKKLTFANGTKVVLPEDGNFYQILPLSSGLFTEENANVTVALKGENEIGEIVENEIAAELTQTGAIFVSGTILAWSDPSGVWSEDQIQRPWIKNGARSSFSREERAYFPDVLSGGKALQEANVDVAMAIVSPFTCFANKNTGYTFRRSAMESAQAATITFDSLSIGGVTRFELPTFYETRLYIAGGTFVGTDVTTPLIEIAANGSFEAEAISTRFEEPSEVLIHKDATLVLAGEHSAIFEFAAGSKLKAVNLKALNWTDKTTFLWPAEGKVVVDVSDFVAVQDPTVIISGVKADMSFLRHFETTDALISLALNEAGDVCLVKCESEDANWLNDRVVTLENVESTYEVMAAEHYATLTFMTNALESVLRLNVPVRDRFLADELHLENVAKVEITDLKLGTGTLYAANETHLYGDTSGVLSMTLNDAVYIHTPKTPWTLAEGVQGKIYVGITPLARAERQKVFKVDAALDWPIGGLDVYPYDFEQDIVRDDFSILKEGEWVYLVPPGVKGTVSAEGETAWSTLTWYAYDGEIAEIKDWTNIYSAEIVSENDAAVVVMDGAPRTMLKTSGAKLTLEAVSDLVLPRELVVENALTIKGDILPQLDYVKGDGKLILDTGAVTEIIVLGSAMPIEATVEIRENSYLRIAHETYFQNKAADFTRLIGSGTLEIKDVTGGKRFIMPANKLMFSKDLAFVLNTELELQDCHKSVPLEVSNLSGSGTYGYGKMTIAELLGQLNSGNFSQVGTRVLKTRQTKTTEWTSTLPQWFGMRSFGKYLDAKLVVSGAGDLPPLERRFVYSGISAEDYSMSNAGEVGNYHDIEIESTGSFELDGFWNGTIYNNGILVLGRRRVIKSSVSTNRQRSWTNFEGSGKIATLGDKIDLIDYPVFKEKYALASGTFGEVDFEVTDFAAETEVMNAEANFTFSEAGDLMLVAVNGEERQWQKVTADNFKNGKLVWLASGGQGTGEALVFELKSESNDIDTLVADQYLGGAANLTIRGTAASDYLDATSRIGLFKGELTLDKATVKCVSPMEAKLAKNPTGKLIFVVENTSREIELMKLADGFTYDPQLFSVEVVDGEGNPSDAYWTWTAQDGVLKYVLTDPKTSKYMPRGYACDQNLAGWGTSSLNLGQPTLDKFVVSRNGYAITNYNPAGRDFEIGTNDWTVNWVARLSPDENAVHFALGSNSEGGFALTTVDGSHAAISRWINGQSAKRLITGMVPYATTRFNSYALTYRKGLYTFYINGEKVGSATDIEGATGYPEKVNWQITSIHGSLVGNTSNGWKGAIDDFRLYNVALGEKMIQAIANEFSPWPDKINAEGGEIERDINQNITNLYIEGTGTIHLTRQKGANGVANLIGIEGTAALVIEDGVELVVEMSSTNRNPLQGHQVEIKKGGRLVLKQMDNMYQTGKSMASVDYSNLRGYGTLEFRAANSQLILKMPSSRNYTVGTIARNYWDANLSICINTNIYCDYSYENTAHPLILRNLSGNGKFGLIGNSGEQRYVEIIQTERTTFTGTVPAGVTITVVGEGETLNRNAALVIDPVAALPEGMILKAAANGVIAIKSAANLKNVTIVDDGLVIFEPESYETIEFADFAHFEGADLRHIALSGSGKLAISGSTEGFVLESNPLGTMALEKGATIKVAEGFTFSPIAFHVSVSGKTAVPYVENGVLKARFRPAPKVLFR